MHRSQCDEPRAPLWNMYASNHTVEAVARQAGAVKAVQLGAAGAASRAALSSNIA